MLCKYENMPGNTSVTKNADQVSRYAAMFSAMGTEVRLQVMQLLLSAHPEDLVVGEVQKELRHSSFDPFSSVGEAEERGPCAGAAREYVLTVHANTDALQELLQFLYAKCGTRNKAPVPQDIVQICKQENDDGCNRSQRGRQREIWGQAALRVKTGGNAYCGASPATGKATI